MRRVLPILWLLGGAALAACSRSEAAQQPSEGTLVLELGGPAPSLRQTLAERGIHIGPGHRVVESNETPPPEPAPGPEGEPEPSPGPERLPPAPQPRPQPEPAADYFVVELKPGQTLIHLAKQHLGNGNRYRDLMRLNGWTDQQTRGLRPGTKVKVPKSRR